MSRSTQVWSCQLEPCSRYCFASLLGSSVLGLSTGCTAREEVKYDVATATCDHKLVADRNRRREEAAIRELDGAAASLHRAKKARWQREQRRDVDKATVLQSVMERLIREVERHADALRRREEQSERLNLCGARSSLHVGDLIYMRHPICFTALHSAGCASVSMWNPTPVSKPAHLNVCIISQASSP